METPNTQLRYARQLRGWSQSYLAEQIGVFGYYISRWERGEVLPSPYYQQKLCTLFDRTAEELGFLQPASKALSPGEEKIKKQESPSAREEKIRQENVPPSEAFQERSGASGNPFTYGNPISDPERFFGRKLEVEQVFSRLRNAEFESSSLVGERRIGKTSLLKYLAHPLVRKRFGLDPNVYLFVYVDLQVVDENTTPTRLWQRLLRQIANYCADPDARRVLEEVQHNQPIDNFVLEDAFDALDEMGKYVVLLLDEFEHVTGNKNFSEAFFYGLRSLAIHHHLSLITSSRRELVELCHSEAIRSSPFFNIFATINVGLFAPNEAQALISQSLARTDKSFTSAEMDTLFQFAGLHPYFLQVACFSLFDTYLRNYGADERIASFRKALREEARPHLTFYWHSSSEHEKIALTASMIAESQRESSGSDAGTYHLHDLYPYSGQTLAQLEKRSLIVPTGNTFSLFSRSFGEWIWSELTETRGNKQAYNEWLSTHQQLNSIPETIGRELNALLARVNEQYRELLLHWLIEPRAFNTVGRWIKSRVETRQGESR